MGELFPKKISLLREILFLFKKIMKGNNTINGNEMLEKST